MDYQRLTELSEWNDSLKKLEKILSEAIDIRNVKDMKELRANKMAVDIAIEWVAQIYGEVEAKKLMVEPKLEEFGHMFYKKKSTL